MQHQDFTNSRVSLISLASRCVHGSSKDPFLSSPSSPAYSRWNVQFRLPVGSAHSPPARSRLHLQKEDNTKTTVRTNRRQASQHDTCTGKIHLTYSCMIILHSTKRTSTDLNKSHSADCTLLNCLFNLQKQQNTY